MFLGQFGYGMKFFFTVCILLFDRIEVKHYFKFI